MSQISNKNKQRDLFFTFQTKQLPPNLKQGEKPADSSFSVTWRVTSSKWRMMGKWSVWNGSESNFSLVRDTFVARFLTKPSQLVWNVCVTSLNIARWWKISVVFLFHHGIDNSECSLQYLTIWSNCNNITKNLVGLHLCFKFVVQQPTRFHVMRPKHTLISVRQIVQRLICMIYENWLQWMMRYFRTFVASTRVPNK